MSAIALNEGPAARVVNEAYLAKFTSDDWGLRKEASDMVNEYTRVKMREDGFLRRIMPPMTITNDQLDKQVDTDKPVKVVDKEPNSPGAISVPFATLPMNRYIKGPRYRVMFDRILTPKFTKDVDELRTYDMDIRQILSDNSIKDMLAEEDTKYVATINSLLIGQNVIVTETGVAQWVKISGGVTRDTWMEALKVLPRTPSHLNAATVLINNVTIFDIAKWGRDEMGGDMAQDAIKDGFTERDFAGVRLIITIKRDLVPDGTIFMFAQPKFMGKLYILEEATMYVDRKAFMLEFFAYESLGCCIANVASVGRVDFAA